MSEFNITEIKPIGVTEWCEHNYLLLLYKIQLKNVPKYILFRILWTKTQAIDELINSPLSGVEHPINIVSPFILETKYYKKAAQILKVKPEEFPGFVEQFVSEDDIEKDVIVFEIIKKEKETALIRNLKPKINRYIAETLNSDEINKSIFMTTDKDIFFAKFPEEFQN